MVLRVQITEQFRWRWFTFIYQVTKIIVSSNEGVLDVGSGKGDIRIAYIDLPSEPEVSQFAVHGVCFSV